MMLFGCRSTSESSEDGNVSWNAIEQPVQPPFPQPVPLQPYDPSQVPPTLTPLTQPTVLPQLQPPVPYGQPTFPQPYAPDAQQFQPATPQVPLMMPTGYSGMPQDYQQPGKMTMDSEYSTAIESDELYTTGSGLPWWTVYIAWVVVVTLITFFRFNPINTLILLSIAPITSSMGFETCVPQIVSSVQIILNVYYKWI